MAMIANDMTTGVVSNARVHSVPGWYVPAREQKRIIRQLFPGITIPPQPRRETLRDSELLMLYVAADFDALWDLVTPPEGYEKKRSQELTRELLNLGPRRQSSKVAQWIAFQPESGRGAQTKFDPAEYGEFPNIVLMALILFPEWPMAWFGGDASAPRMGHYPMQFMQGKTHVPVVTRWEAGPKILCLTYHIATIKDMQWATPTARALK